MKQENDKKIKPRRGRTRKAIVLTFKSKMLPLSSLLLLLALYSSRHVTRSAPSLSLSRACARVEARVVNISQVLRDE